MCSFYYVSQLIRKNNEVRLLCIEWSGNKSKQYNVFDGYLMYFGAMSQEKRNRRENTMFICTSDENLQSVDMPDAIVDDLSALGQEVENISW